MSIPVGYFYKNGFYWKTDGTGPYTFDGTSMLLCLYPVVASTTSLFKDKGYFNADGSGPATKS